MILATKSADDTRALAAEMAGLVQARDIVLLCGDLGAGKTTFAQGFGRALGIDEPITSPTFTLIRQYDEGGRVPLLHADVYRLDHVQEVIDLGLSELIDEGRVALIEWGDVAAPALPADYLTVRIDFLSGDVGRRITLRALGPSWSARLAMLERVLTPWQVGADE